MKSDSLPMTGLAAGSMAMLGGIFFGLVGFCLGVVLGIGLVIWADKQRA